MNLQTGTVYPTANGGHVRIVVDDRKCCDGRRFIGLYDEDKSERVLTYDDEGHAFIFNTPEPEMNIVEKRRFYLISYYDNGKLVAKVWDNISDGEETIENYLKQFGFTGIRITYVEQGWR